jgi:hypothetical protein
MRSKELHMAAEDEQPQPPPLQRHRVDWPAWPAWLILGAADFAGAAYVIYGLRVREVASYATDKLGPADYLGIVGAAILSGVLVFAGFFAAAQIATYSVDPQRKPTATYRQLGRAVVHRIVSIVVPVAVMAGSLSLVYVHAYDETARFGKLAWEKLTTPKSITTGSIPKRRPQQPKETTVMEDLAAWWGRNVKEPPPPEAPWPPGD